jgi:hypothetical protein
VSRSKVVVGDYKTVLSDHSNFLGNANRGQAKAFMHLARFELVEEDEVFTVSFLKRQSDGSYTWPLNEDISVELHELVIVKKPTEDLCCSRARINIKLVFHKTDLEEARKLLDISISNIR